MKIHFNVSDAHILKPFFQDESISHISEEKKEKIQTYHSFKHLLDFLFSKFFEIRQSYTAAVLFVQRIPIKRANF